MSRSVGCCVTVTVGLKDGVVDGLKVGKVDERVDGVREVSAVGADDGIPDGDTAGCKVVVVVG